MSNHEFPGWKRATVPNRIWKSFSPFWRQEEVQWLRVRFMKKASQSLWLFNDQPRSPEKVVVVRRKGIPPKMPLIQIKVVEKSASKFCDEKDLCARWFKVHDIFIPIVGSHSTIPKMSRLQHCRVSVDFIQVCGNFIGTKISPFSAGPPISAGF